MLIIHSPINFYPLHFAQLMTADSFIILSAESKFDLENIGLAEVFEQFECKGYKNPVFVIFVNICQKNKTQFVYIGRNDSLNTCFRHSKKLSTEIRRHHKTKAKSPFTYQLPIPKKKLSTEYLSLIFKNLYLLWHSMVKCLWKSSQECPATDAEPPTRNPAIPLQKENRKSVSVVVKLGNWQFKPFYPKVKSRNWNFLSGDGNSYATGYHYTYYIRF